MLATRAVADDLITQLREQISALSELVTRHRATPMVARTLTQHAAPTTFGAKAAAWLNRVVDAFDRMAALTAPVKSAAPRALAATTELAALLTGSSDPAGVAAGVAADTATALGLAPRAPAHRPRADHRRRRRVRRLHRLLGPHRLRHRHAGPPRDRRTQRADGRQPGRLVVHAAQA